MDRIVVIGASAGGLKPLQRITAALPDHGALSVFVVMHVGAHPSVLPSLLSRAAFPAGFAEAGELIEAGRIYVAPPDQHMLLQRGHIRLWRGPKVHRTRPAVDPLFTSAAEAYGNRVVGIVLSGGDSDGASGLRTIKDHGGIAFVQRPEDAAAPSMPLMAIALDHPNASLSVDEIISRLIEICGPQQGKPCGEGITRT